jgi:hypothetical protein
MREQCSLYAYLWVCALLAGINGFAFAGAAIGCCFYMAAPRATSLRERFFLSVFSFGMGYGGGIYWYGGPPPYSEKAMIIAGAISALIAVVFTALGYMVEKDGPVPEWIKTIIGLIPFFKSRGGNDGA